MGCCGKTKKTTAMADIKRDRGCTDIIMLLAFLASFAIIPIIHMEAVKAGADPTRSSGVWTWLAGSAVPRVP